MMLVVVGFGATKWQGLLLYQSHVLDSLICHFGLRSDFTYSTNSDGFCKLIMHRLSTLAAIMLFYSLSLDLYGTQTPIMHAK